ncbi:MAG TPA: deoxyribodipyrimidine photo-lyase [Pseudomonadales bacterium]|nr:deoxyribodipyrimidine photo-lyase [Pseudomonadales bacterium]
MSALVWFRNDLRTQDHSALAAATRSGEKQVVAVYIVCPEEWQLHDTAPIRVHFIFNHLADLREKLSKLNIQLQVLVTDRYRKIPSTLARFAAQIKASECHFICEYPVNERNRDQEATRLLERQAVKVYAHHQQCLIQPGQILTREGTYFKVFTQFKKTWIHRAQLINWQLEKPKAAKQITSLELNPIPFELAPLPSADPAQWPTGEHSAQKRLRAFCEKKIMLYKDDRDFPAREGTSTLSPYLAIGSISARNCLVQALSLNQGFYESGNPGISSWINELIWRDFYQHIVFGYPHVCKNKPFKLETSLIEWNHSDVLFDAWSTGQTGFPLVDAAMRQLLNTGWMHNRLRMVTAMFLTKNLFIDWRRGEKFFMQHLIDGDFAANNGGWQWSASTGTDAAPYFRIFNPITQSERFDPDGAFIRSWIPELADCDSKHIHEPQKHGDLLFSTSGYPRQIVDLKQSKQRVLDAFKSLNDARQLLIPE